MDWYYANEGRQRGPIDDAEFNNLIAAGTIHADTMIWRSGMKVWCKFSDYGELPAAQEIMEKCVECGHLFPPEEMVQFKASWICGACKPLFFQKIREGVSLPGVMKYGGFWIRFVAKILDVILLGMVNGAISAITSPLLTEAEDAIEGFLLVQGVLLLVQLSLAAVYETVFVGKYGATPGKMACRLKVVREDGTSVSYALALGRHLAEYLSGIILGIGYLMAAFDSEKRALHDRICNTRVIKK